MCFLRPYKSILLEKLSLVFPYIRTMRLLIDIGNTQIKYYLYHNGAFQASGYAKTLPATRKLLKREWEKIAVVVYADVQGIVDHVKLQNTFNPIPVVGVKQLKPPFKSQYKTPKTLGDDRIALVAAATKKYSDQNCLIIDAGSCLTFDFITANNQYLGGSISPGLSMRFKALHQFTGKLPLVTAKNISKGHGNSTFTSIQTGVVQGILHEVEGQIGYYEKKFAPLTVILTGGDGLFLSKSLKNTIFAEPYFLAEGLDFLYEYNSF